MTGADWSSLLMMGRHGLYVWPAFGFTVTVLVGLVLHGWWARRQLVRALRRQWAREARS